MNQTFTAFNFIILAMAMAYGEIPWMEWLPFDGWYSGRVMYSA